MRFSRVVGSLARRVRLINAQAKEPREVANPNVRFGSMAVIRTNWCGPLAVARRQAPDEIELRNEGCCVYRKVS